MDKIFKLSDPQFHEKKIQNLKNNLILNNYPVSFIDKHIKNAILRRNAQLANSDENETSENPNQFD